jgi:protein ImuA
MVIQKNSIDGNSDRDRLTTVLELRSSLRNMQPGLRREVNEKAVVSTSISALDAMLPNRGLQRGTLSEWIAAEPGSGAVSLAMRVARQAQQGGPLIIVDRQRQIYAPAISASKVSLAHTILIHPRSRADELWAIEQSLRCSGVGAVLCQVDHLKTQEFRRLQLAAESGTAVGLLLRSATAQSQSGWADIRLLVSPRASPPQLFCRRVAVRCVYAKGGLIDRTIELDICDETSAVCLAAGFPDSAAAL